MTEPDYQEQSKYLEVKGKIKQKILDGTLAGKLPGERLLAKEYRYSYMTIRHAITELGKEGFLVKSPRKGTFVSNPKMHNKRSSNIGFFLYEKKVADGISGPYYSMIFKCLQREVLKHGFQLTFYNRFEDIDPSRVEGIIATGLPGAEQELINLSKSVSLVLIDNEIIGQRIPVVLLDNYQSAFESTEYAYKLGHRKLGYVTGMQDADIGTSRLRGYQSALKKNKLSENPDYIYYGDYEFESGYKSAKHFLSLKDRPTFIICANDMMAIGLMKGVSEAGLKVPDDISISGFDNIEMSDRIYPALTTMAVDFEDLVAQCMELLMKELRFEDITDFHRVLKTRLIERQSCCPY